MQARYEAMHGQHPGEAAAGILATPVGVEQHPGLDKAGIRRSDSIWPDVTRNIAEIPCLQTGKNVKFVDPDQNVSKKEIMMDILQTREALGQLLIWTNVEAIHEQDFNRWYDRKHMEERVRIPGFIWSRR
ncbi:MAG: hypothetical protein LBI62_09970 [Candidatus Accumulibacter sp.]|jgi:hypothetical protein|nr:hypothetical protein [Accumulibacter sp.]